MFTRSSVVWAERIVAARSWKGLSWRRAHSSRADPGYSTARRATVSRARPLGVLGIATKRTLCAARFGECLPTVSTNRYIANYCKRSVTVRRIPVRERSPTPMTEGFDVPHRHRGRARLLPCSAVRRPGAGVRSHYLDQPRRHTAPAGPQRDCGDPHTADRRAARRGAGAAQGREPRTPERRRVGAAAGL